MQVNFCNVVYACKICEETFGGCWWSLVDVNPTQLSGIRTVFVIQFQQIHWTNVSVLVDSKGDKKDSSLIRSFPVLLLQPYEEQSAYCCRDFVPFMVSVVWLNFSTLKPLSE